MSKGKELTREMLESYGVTEVTKDGHMFMGERECLPSERHNGYWKYNFVVGRDESGKRILDQHLWHRIVYAWHHGRVPSNLHVDHINNSHIKWEDYHIDNLQLLTARENSLKNPCKTKKGASTAEFKCNMARPREFYENWLEKLEKEFKGLTPKTNEYNNNRGQRRNVEAYIRYWDSHKDEHEQAVRKAELKKDLLELGYWKNIFKEHDNKKLWRECCTIEKIAKEKGLEAESVVKHALEVIHKTFGRN